MQRVLQALVWSIAPRSSEQIAVGSSANCPMLTVMSRYESHLIVGSESVRVVPALGPAETDIVCSRLHGVSPFSGTELDALLRNLGVGTVLVTGVSVNLGVLGLAIEAVNLGYQVALATDAVAGVPADYAEAVMANTMTLLASRVTVDQAVETWSG